MEYNIWVVAINEVGPGAATEEITVRTFTAEPTEPPYNITLEPASSTVINCIKLLRSYVQLSLTCRV